MKIIGDQKIIDVWKHKHLKMGNGRETINFFAKNLRNESEFSDYETATERWAERKRIDKT